MLSPAPWLGRRPLEQLRRVEVIADDDGRRGQSATLLALAAASLRVFLFQSKQPKRRDASPLPVAALFLLVSAGVLRNQDTQTGSVHRRWRWRSLTLAANQQFFENPEEPY